MMKEPTPRYATYDAIQFLAKRFDYPCDEILQDWEYIVADIADIEAYFETYTLVDDDDIRFLLMQMIIETHNERDWINKYWGRVEALIKADFRLHEYNVYYWSSFEFEDLEDCFYITPYMRKLWLELSNQTV